MLCDIKFAVIDYRKPLTFTTQYYCVTVYNLQITDLWLFILITRII